jgi:hypothetical protein
MSIGDNNLISAPSAKFPGASHQDLPLTDTARYKITQEFGAVLAGIVYRLRKPLLTVALLPVPTAGLLMGFAVYLGGPLGIILALMAAVPLLLGVWLMWQRAQMLAAADPMEDLARDVGRLIDRAVAWSYAEESITILRGYSRNGWGPFRILRGVWTTLNFGASAFQQGEGLPRRVVPFSPRRLQATASVAGFCLIGSGVAVFIDLLIAVALATLV